MASADGAWPGEEALTTEILVTGLQELSGTGQAPPGDRCRLKLSTFRGDSNVKQFIKEFENVATIAE